MQHIKLNLLQIIILIIFIYVFTYYWLPRKQTNESDEYIKLLEKYNKILYERNYYKTEINKISDVHAMQQTTSIGKSISAHSGAIVPRNINQNDNLQVRQMLH
jgi:hypothetical protein